MCARIFSFHLTATHVESCKWSPRLKALGLRLKGTGSRETVVAVDDLSAWPRGHLSALQRSSFTKRL